MSLGSDIQILGLRHDLIAEIMAQKIGRIQIDILSHDSGEFLFDLKELEPDAGAGLEDNQYIDITSRTEIIAEHRSEQSQSTDRMPTTEIFYDFSGYVDSAFLHAISPAQYIHSKLLLTDIICQTAEVRSLSPKSTRAAYEDQTGNASDVYWWCFSHIGAGIQRTEGPLASREDARA